MTDAPQPVAAWRPMADCPKDATVQIAVGRKDGQPMFNGKLFTVYPAYVDEHGRFCDCGTWKPDSGFDGPHFHVIAWQPLAEPPAAPLPEPPQ